jgi:Rhodopirellula transposase DDE domain
MGAEESFKARWLSLQGQLDERQRRRLLATQARALGYAGIAIVHRATGVSRATISAGLRELASGEAGRDSPRVRQAGGGRKLIEERDPAVVTDLLSLVDESTRGDPESPLRWCCKSLRVLTAHLQGLGHAITHTVVARLLKAQGFSLQGNAKVIEGHQSPDRDAQFQCINATVKAALAAGQPVISVDTKKKELVGSYKNAGQTWRPKGQPEKVQVHDFVDPELGRANPYGVYDIGANEAWVSVGTDHDTSAFAVETIRRWWRTMGQPRYPDAKELVITADGGGSNGHRVRLWKLELAQFARDSGLSIHVRHFPPGTSKWNKIEHRLFSFISLHWRGRPLISHEVIVNLIASTTTAQGLKVRAALDTTVYPKGQKVDDATFKHLPIDRQDFHGDWNYTIRPDGSIDK